MKMLSREQMTDHILDLIAGQDTDAGFFALADAMAISVGGMADVSGCTLEEAVDYLDGLHDGMRDHIVMSWGKIEATQVH
jgi:hypothetical protein